MDNRSARFSVRLFALGLLTTLLWGCSGVQVEEGPPPPMDEFLDSNNYQIGVGDEISIQVWRNEELSVRVPVRPDGKVSSPLVGDIVAAGLTTEELGEQIEARLRNYVREPAVTVIVNNPASSNFLRRVRVTGAVRNPVSVNHHQGMTILDLVLGAGGLTEFANGNDAKLYRTVEGVTKVYAVKLDDILKRGKMQTNYTLYPSDVVSVPERAF